MWTIRIFTAIALAVVVGCAEDDATLSFAVSGDAIIATGDIDSGVLDRFEDVVADNPGIKTLVLQFVGGSVDDEANTEFARVVRDMGLATRVPSGGLVASGGTDLFLAGITRVAEPGACLGVHQWAADDFVASDVPRSDPEHLRYLDYYDDMGIDRAFYWFTLDAAPADSMHWMTGQEVAQFGLTTTRVASLGSAAVCDAR